MNKKIKLFEAFAGIGSQAKALDNISSKMGWKIEIVGIIEWFIPAICAYVEIHSKNKLFRIKNNNEKKKYLDYFKTKSLSLDSKKPVNANSMNKTIERYFNYLYISKTEFNNTFDITKTEYTDISKDIDIFTYSFPCQDLSNQGKQKGMKKNSGTRSGLLWEVERILTNMHNNWKQSEMPKYLLLENVIQIGNYKNIKSLNDWIKSLDELG